MTRFCTTCGSPLDDNAAFCTNCGAPVEAVSEETQTTQPTEAIASETMVMEQPVEPPMQTRTPQIQTPVIQAPIAGSPAAQPAKKSNTPLIVGIVIAVVVIIAAILVGVFVFGEEKSDSPQNPSTPSTTTTAPTTYKVTFQTNGGSSVSTATVDQGGMLSSPQTPTREGYTFDGWYLDAGCTRAAIFPLKVESDMTLYANWTDDRSASDVTISIVGRDGSTRTATIHRQGSTGRIFPNSNTSALTESEVRALSDAERCVAWNEIIAAANGYEFKNGGLRNYFTQDCEWYKPNPSSNGTENLSSVANKNIEMLKRYTDSWWLSLATN